MPEAINTNNWQARGNGIHDWVSPTYGLCIAITEGDTQEEKAKRAAFLCTAAKAYNPLVEACQKVAAFRNCHDAADWKDAFNQLTSACAAALERTGVLTEVEEDEE